MTVLPMFPLGSVLLPHQQLPLHVFEPRYRALVHDCLDGDKTFLRSPATQADAGDVVHHFGVVLIERGSEVGGGDTRFDAGCTAIIEHAEESPDGRWGLVCKGGARLRVVRWLDDDPYPRAEVELLEDGSWTADAGVALEGALAAFRRVVDLVIELGGNVDPSVLELPGPGLVDHWLLADRAPISELDKLAILAADTPERRLDLLAAELTSVADVLASRKGGG